MEHTGLIAADALVPKHLGTLTETQIKDVLSYYGKFLQHNENLEVEIEKWKLLYKDVAVAKRPQDAVAALAACDCDYFPALKKIFTIFLTTPVLPVSDHFQYCVA